MKLKHLQSITISTLLLLTYHSFANTPINKQLNNVQQAIANAQKELNEKEVAQKQAQATLEKTRIAIAKVQRELDALNKQQQDTWNKLQELQNTLSRLQAEITSTKAQVSRLLLAHYKNRQPNSVELFLKNIDPNQKSRFLNYTRYINEANNHVLKQLAQQKEELNHQEEAINTQLEKLKQLSLAQQQKMRELGKNQSKAQAETQKLNTAINRQKANLAKLRTDEKRLTQVIAEFNARQLAKQQAETKQNKSTQTKIKSITPPTNIGLGKQQGRLPFPTQGQVVGQFGDTRPTGGVWRGLFIETKPTPVKSIAEGTVSYAANLPGYGNTIVIDHGSGYVSIYTGLSNIGVQEGNQVQSNQHIGTTGQLPAGEEGLYFELRYRNQPVNPRSWLR